MKRKVTKETEMLRKARQRKGLSQQQVAVIAGVHIRQYQRLEYPVLAWDGKEHCATILADHCIARTRRLLHFTIAQRFFLR